MLRSIRPVLVLSLALLAIAPLLLLAACGGGGGGGSVGRAIVTLLGTDEIAQVDLSTGVVTRVSSSPVQTPGIVLYSGTGTGGYVLSDGQGLVGNVDLAGIPAMGSTVRDLEAWYSASAHSALVKNGLLAILTDNQDLLLWDRAGNAWTEILDPPEASGMWDVCADPTGTRFYVADYNARSRGGVFVFDNTGAVIDTLFYAGLGSAIPSTTYNPVALGVSPDGGKLYVANYGSDWDTTTDPDDMLIFSLDASGHILTNTILHVPLVDKDDASKVARLYDSQGLEFSADGQEVYIAGDENGTLAVYHVATGLVDVLKLDPLNADPPHATSLFRGGGRLFLPGHDGSYRGNDLLYVVEEASFAVAGTIAFPAGSHPTSVIVVP